MTRETTSMAYRPAMRRGDATIHMSDDGKKTLCAFQIDETWIIGERTDILYILLGELRPCLACARASGDTSAAPALRG